ncbi:DUF1217 domain-containing protein [Mesorhizobium sp. 1B3]|uniref:DUF1217 domain-containing protein n=1 Tax=Mesorhizobium sp. 1B3 TaxID=3243599 RepID=UPI003D972AC6
MINTYTSYKLITRDLAKSIDRIEAQPMIKRETEYYLANIGKVKSIDEFLKNDRLFRYAMKAHGLEDMAYAKAFMRKALEGGISDQNSFANKLTDKRYAEFVRTYNFADFGGDATSYNVTNQGTVARYTLWAAQAGVEPDNPVLKEHNAYFAANIGKVKSIKEFVENDQLFEYAMKAYGLADKIADKDLMIEMLEGGVDDPKSPANVDPDERFKEFVSVFNFVRNGEKTTNEVAAQQPAVDKYMRQTLEEDAGQQNEGVRLALYFTRNASKITGPFDVLADKALATVVRTALGLPDSIASADIDRQAKMLEDRIDFTDFQDPAKLEKFMARFTALWEIKNPTSTALSSVASLISQPSSQGISIDALMTLQRVKFGG